MVSSLARGRRSERLLLRLSAAPQPHDSTLLRLRRHLLDAGICDGLTVVWQHSALWRLNFTSGKSWPHPRLASLYVADCDHREPAWHSYRRMEKRRPPTS